MTSEGGLATRCSREDAPRQDGRAGGAHSGPAQKVHAATIPADKDF